MPPAGGELRVRRAKLPSPAPSWGDEQRRTRTLKPPDGSEAPHPDSVSQQKSEKTKRQRALAY